MFNKVLSLFNILNPVDLLLHKDWKKRLGYFGDVRAIPSLFAAIMDRNEYVRGTTEKTLDKIDSNWREIKETRESIPDLVSALKDPDESVRLIAWEALDIIDPE